MSYYYRKQCAIAAIESELDNLHNFLSQTIHEPGQEKNIVALEKKIALLNEQLNECNKSA